MALQVTLYAKTELSTYLMEFIDPMLYKCTVIILSHSVRISKVVIFLKICVLNKWVSSQKILFNYTVNYLFFLFASVYAFSVLYLTNVLIYTFWCFLILNTHFVPSQEYLSCFSISFRQLIYLSFFRLCQFLWTFLPDYTFGVA